MSNTNKRRSTNQDSDCTKGPGSVSAKPEFSYCNQNYHKSVEIVIIMIIKIVIVIFII